MKDVIFSNAVIVGDKLALLGCANSNKYLSSNTLRNLNGDLACATSS
jgi:hypothetical protein